MKLRWFRTYNPKTGMKTEASLQFWDEDLGIWEDVVLVEYLTDEESIYY